MTENEALKLGKSLCENITSNANNIIPTKEYIEFVGMAIQALEEIQQYRAIGTVEGYKRAIGVSKENYYLCAEYKAKLKEYESIGTVEDFKALKDAEEQGLLLRLPCKMNDEAWAIRNYKGVTYAQKGFVNEMFFTKDMQLVIVVKNIARGEFGKTVFLTKEEAEQALAKMQGT